MVKVNYCGGKETFENVLNGSFFLYEDALYLKVDNDTVVDIEAEEVITAPLSNTTVNDDIEVILQVK